MTLRLVVEHRTGRVVHGAYGITDEGQPQAVVGFAFAVELHAAHAFVGQHVGVLVVQSAGVEGAVEVDEDVVLGGFTGSALVEVHHPLVLTVHEVNLHALDAPFLELREEVHVVVHGQPRQPYDDAHALIPGVGEELGQVHVGIRVEGVTRVQRPPFVHENITHAIASVLSRTTVTMPTIGISTRA